MRLYVLLVVTLALVACQPGPAPAARTEVPSAAGPATAPAPAPTAAPRAASPTVALPPSSPTAGAGPATAGAASNGTASPAAGTPQAGRVTLALGASGQVEVRAEVAANDAERSRGLMFRQSLPEGEGMLFVFPGDVRVGFWMENTLVPLSIAFIAADGSIVGLDDMAPLTREAHAPQRAYRFALEVPQGFFARRGIKEGDVVRWREGAALRPLVELPQARQAS